MQSKHIRLFAVILMIAATTTGSLASAATTPADDSTQARFDDALAAIEANRLRTARESLRSLLAENPSLLRARLELAKVYYQTADFAAAREEAERVLADPELPPSVRVTVLAFLAQINADEQRVWTKHQWSPSVYAGLMYDTNVNFGPSRDIVEIGGLPVLLTPETDDFAAVLAAGVTHTYNPGRRFEWGEHTGAFFWQSQANGYYRAYFDEDDFNFGVLTLRTGPVWVVPRQWRASIGLQGDQIWLGGDSLALYTTLNPTITWMLSDATELTLDGVVTQRHYWDSDEDARDGWYKGLSLIVDHNIRGTRFTVQGGVGYVWFDADDDRFSYEGPDVFGGIAYGAWTNGMIYARVGYRRYDFEGPEPLFGIARDEDEIRTTLGFQHDFVRGTLEGWSLQGNWIYTNNDSNVAIYDYDRNQFNLGLARSF